MVGCGFPQEKQGMNLGRRAALLAGLPDTVPGTTVNRFCASIAPDDPDGLPRDPGRRGRRFVAAGVESITQVYGYPKDAEELHPKLFGDDAPIANVYIPMGLTAENVAERWDVSREEMDRVRAALAGARGRGAGSQASSSASSRRTRGGRHGRGADDGPRADSTLEKLAALEPAFMPGGKVTAGNACPLNDGAAAVVVMSRHAGARAWRAAAGADHRLVGLRASSPRSWASARSRPCGACSTQAGMTIDDVDVMELNEAFAAQVLPVCRELGVDPFGEKLNPHGGAIALGHPYGMTGARIMCTLLNDLETLDKTIGLETMCVGGGQGMAMLVERLD